MAGAQDDFWPKGIGETNLVTPVSIMRTQAALLGDKTNQQVTAAVQPIVGNPSEFVWSFQLSSTALGSYRYELFRVIHSLTLYPATFIWENHENKVAANQEQFTEALKEILGSDQTKKIISALLAQIVR